MCLPFQHEYSKWSEAFDRTNQFHLRCQSRVCFDCGKIVVRKIWRTDWCLAETTNRVLKAVREGRK